MPEINLHDFFEYFRGAKNGEPQQSEAVQMLQSAMPQTLLRDNCPWVEKFRETPPPPPVPESVLPPQGVALICEFEGFRANVYNDGVGVATIGYGSTYYLNGKKVNWGDPPITEPEGREMMEAVAEKDFWNVISRTIPYWDDMNANQQSCKQRNIQINDRIAFFRAGGKSVFRIVTIVLSQIHSDDIFWLQCASRWTRSKRSQLKY